VYEKTPLSLGRWFGLVGGFLGSLVWVPAILFALSHVGGWWPLKFTLGVSLVVFVNCCALARWSYSGVPRKYHKTHGQSYPLFALLYGLSQVAGALVVCCLLRF
jgi:hypothetical protein